MKSLDFHLKVFTREAAVRFRRKISTVVLRIEKLKLVAGTGLEPVPRAYGARMVTLPPPRDIETFS